MKYFKVLIEFTVPMALETPAREELHNLMNRIRQKQELQYGRNVLVRCQEDTIDPPFHKPQDPDSAA